MFCFGMLPDFDILQLVQLAGAGKVEQIAE